jgi:hypothetical protein
MVNNEELNKVSKEVKRYIVKEYMRTSYHWTVGILSFLAGTFFGMLIK